MQIKSRLTCLLITLILTGAAGTAHAQTSSYEELQAAYIFNFAKYVTWPTPSQSFVIGIYGEIDVMDNLKKALSEKKIRGKIIELKIIETTDDIRDCHIIYVPASGSKNIKQLITDTKGESILIVTEEDLIKKGASISFVVDEDRLKFKLKESALSQAGLSASEGLLKLAIRL